MANKDIKVDNKNKKSFLKGFKAELKKVIWPTPKQLVNSTTAVVTIVIITAVIVFGLDMIFKSINDIGVNKLRDWAQSSIKTESNENSNVIVPEDQSQENINTNVDVNE